MTDDNETAMLAKALAIRARITAFLADPADTDAPPTAANDEAAPRDP